MPYFPNFKCYWRRFELFKAFFVLYNNKFEIIKQILAKMKIKENNNLQVKKNRLNILVYP